MQNFFYDKGHLVTVLLVTYLIKCNKSADGEVVC
jgi:hypothetical protein